MCFGGPTPQPPRREINRQDEAAQTADAFETRRRRARGIGANILAGARPALAPAPLGARLLLGG